MNFADAVGSIPTIHALKRTASAHVVDYGHLDSNELRANIRRVKNQFTHPEAVEGALSKAFWRHEDLCHRVLAPLILRDILLSEYEHMLPMDQLQESVIELEQEIVNESNEEDLKGLCGGREDSEQYRNLTLYHFVLETAWKHRDTKSIDEANLLRRLRERLRITRREHRLLEAMLGKFPKPHNDLHTREEIIECVRSLESLGLLFEVRDESGQDYAVIPQEVAEVIRHVLGVEIRRPGYMELLQDKRVRLKSYLKGALEDAGIPFSPSATRSELQERVADTVRPSVLIGGSSLYGGLNSDVLSQWCADLGLPVGGRKAEKVERILQHYDRLQTRVVEEGDERERLYRFYEQLAARDIHGLRAQHVVEKDNEIERCFEAATDYLFETKLNHTPLRQAGTEHADGRLSFRDGYVLWDNKSSEQPVSLRNHIRQFDQYIRSADKLVPVFLVIAYEFTHDSDAVALQYTAENIGRSICLATASEIKKLAELWARDANKRRSEPFPLGLLARSGRLDLEAVRGLLDL